MSEPTTATLKLSPYHALVASGSDISNPDVDSGYQPALVRELARIGTKGGTITVDARGARDLAEFASDLANAVAQDPNPSGAASLNRLSDRAHQLARELQR